MRATVGVAGPAGTRTENAWRHLGWRAWVGSTAALVVAVLLGTAIGVVRLPPLDVLRELLDHLPFVDVASGLSSTDAALVWEIRFPRVVLAAVVGATLSVAGASYQGVFRNPLVDPYLLGVAAGAGLGATLALVYLRSLAVEVGGFPLDVLPVAAFAGGALAVLCAYALGRSAGGRSVATLVLAGVAVASFFTALQGFVFLMHTDRLRSVFAWIMGALTTASWTDVALVGPYAVVALIILLAHGRLLDVLAVGDEEATSLGVNPGRVRLTVVIVATAGTAAAVSISGLIGFVGIIVPHGLRLLFGSSYRRLLPLAALVGGAFLVLADLIARTVIAPVEVPIGVVTALAGAPFFLVLLRRAGRPE